MTVRILSFIATLGIITAASAGEWTAVIGRVVLDGPVPVAAELKVNKDEAHCLSKGKLLNEEWVVNPSTKAVKNVFVWLASDANGSGKALPVHPSLQDIPAAAVEIDQPVCAFVPRAVALREGQKLIVKNSSPVAHNVNWQGSQLKNPGSNVIVPSGKEHAIPNLKADKFPVSIACNMHPWMRGYARVFDSPYFAVTGDDGTFEIKNAPTGKWHLFVWHEGAGWKGKSAGKNGEEVTLTAGSTDLGDLKLTP